MPPHDVPAGKLIVYVWVTLGFGSAEQIVNFAVPKSGMPPLATVRIILGLYQLHVVPGKPDGRSSILKSPGLQTEWQSVLELDTTVNPVGFKPVHLSDFITKV